MWALLASARKWASEMLVAYSVMNTTDHWIEVLPPQIELNSPDRVQQEERQEETGSLQSRSPSSIIARTRAALLPGNARTGRYSSRAPVSSRVRTGSCCNSQRQVPSTLHS